MWRSALAALLILSTTLACAQRRPGGVPPIRTSPVELSVRLVYDDNSQSPSEPCRVQLINLTGSIVGETFSDSRGEARFSNITDGDYRVKVTGNEIEDSTSDTFSVGTFSAIAIQMVTVKRTAAAQNVAGQPISAAALGIPDKAREEYEKGLGLLDKKDHDEAIKHFTRATEMYPQFAAALDAIGIAHVTTSPQLAKADFLRALDADKQFFPAYPHLAQVYMMERDWARAEEVMLQAVPLDPRSAEALYLLAFAQLKQKKYDLVIANMERTHQLDHEKYSLVHFVAGEAYAMSARPQLAIDQYSLYLKEDPLGRNAEMAKSNIEKLRAATSHGAQR
jgi:tetratricopeptide (TPR) repeat protein